MILKIQTIFDTANLIFQDLIRGFLFQSHFLRMWLLRRAQKKQDIVFLTDPFYLNQVVTLRKNSPCLAQVKFLF